MMIDDNPYARCAICAEPVFTNHDVHVMVKMADGDYSPAHRSHLSEPGGEEIELEDAA